MAKLPQVDLYTDGGCRPNPGPGGWGVVMVTRGEELRELSGGDPDTTNNRMEIIAAVEGLRALEGPRQVQLYTDSRYLRQGILEWLPQWRASGWRTSAKKAVKNQDLWLELEAELERHEVTWHWVKGHAGNRYNERADRLAAAAIPRPSLPVIDPDAVHLFTSAAFSGKKGIGSWAVLMQYVGHERMLSGAVTDTTANRMHIAAAVAGLNELRRSVRVHVYTASDYLRDGATSWLASWKSRKWRTREGKDVSHRDLWRKLDRLLRRHEVRWHAVDRNDLPEEMERAKAAAREALKSGP
jgi:ribonuclease HI